MGSPKQPKQTTQIVKNENIPEWMRPYVSDVAARGQAVSREGYQPYGGQRVAGFSQPQMDAFSETAALGRPADFQTARQNYEQAGATGLQLGAMGLQAGQAGMQRANQFLGTPSEQFGQAQADRYMSPYQQAVTDIAIRKAQEESARQAGLSNLGAAGRGSAGGSRQAVMDAMRQRGLTENVGDLQAKGSQQAFQMAQQQFERDRTAAQRQAQLGAQYGMQGLTQLGRAGTLGLQAGQGLFSLGVGQQQTDLQRLDAQQQAGAAQQGLEQQILDQRYADFLRQRDYPREQLGFYSNLVRGLPYKSESSQITYAQPASFGAKALGGAMGLASIYGLGGGFKQ
jgi:hypothetical protein